MKQRIVALLIGIAMSINVFSEKSPKPELSETYQIDWSDQYKSKTRPSEYIGTDKYGNHIYHAYRPTVIPLLFYTRVVMKEYIRVYDDNMNFVEDIRLEDLPSLKGSNWSMHKLIPRQFTEFNGKHYVITQNAKGKKRAGYNLLMREIDIENRSIGNSHKVFSFGNGGRISGSIKYSFSPDKKKVLFYYFVSGKKKSKAKIQYYLVDENLDVVDKGSIRFDKSLSETHMESMIVDNSGKFVFLASYKKSRKELRRERKKRGRKEQNDGKAMQSAEYKMYIGPDKKITGVPFKIDERTIGGITLRQSTDSSFVLFGTFAAKSKDHYSSNLPNYIFTSAVGYSGDIHYVEMEDEVVVEQKKMTRREKRKARRARKGDVKLRGYAGYVYFRNVIFDHDSNYYLIGEYYNRYTRTESRNPGSGASGLSVTVSVSKTITHHDHGNIEVMKFSRDGKLLWHESVYKDNDYEDHGDVSFSRTTFKPFINKKNELHIFFEDNACYMENRKELFDKHHTQRQGTFLVQLQKESGKVNRHLLGSRFFNRKYYSPKIDMAHQRKDGNVILLGHRGLSGKKVKAGVVLIN